MMNVVGPQVRFYRERLDLTQAALVARCHLKGWDISRGTLAKIESQVRRVTDEEVVLLAKVLGLEITQLYNKVK